MFGLQLGGVKQNVVVSPSMAKSILSFPGASSTAMANHFMRNAFGDRGAVRNLKPADSDAFHSSAIMRDTSTAEVSTAEVRLIERETPNLVTFCRSLVDQARWERGSDVTVHEDCDVPTCEANFYSLVRGFTAYISTTVFMGEAFVESFPKLLDDLWTFDSQFTILSLGAPRWLPLPGVSAAYPARKRLLDVFAAFYQAFAAWEDGRDPGMELRDLEDVSEHIKERIRISRKLGLSPRAGASGLLSQFWALVRNTPNIVFWNLLHIYSDPTLLEEIRKEIAPYAKAFRPSCQETGFPFQDPPKLSIDIKGLLDCCPLLKASYYETIRLDSARVSFTQLTSELNLSESKEDAAIDNRTSPRTYKLRKGEYVAVSHGAYQNDTRYFQNPGRYNLQRFIQTDSETGEKRFDMHTITFFDDNTFECKGYVFAEREILAFTAAILSLWDVEAFNGKDWRIPGHKLAVGAFPPKKDVRVKIRARV